MAHRLQPLELFHLSIVIEAPVNIHIEIVVLQLNYHI